nr:MAG TPA: hypothetical protein [Caudoviricetes sp.]
MQKPLSYSCKALPARISSSQNRHPNEMENFSYGGFCGHVKLQTLQFCRLA